LTHADKTGCLQSAGFVETRPFTSNEAVVQSNQWQFITSQLQLCVHHITATAVVTAIYNLRSQLLCGSQT